MAKSIVCPFCFESFPEVEVEYRCTNPHCPSSSEVDPQYTAYRRSKVDLEAGHVFKPGVKKGLFGSRPEVRCDVPGCGSRAVLPICPHCHNPLPESSIDGTNNIISIVGTRNSGKSTYITVLINELTKRIGYKFDAGVSSFVATAPVAGYRAEALYRNTKYQRLYEDHRLLDLTKTDNPGHGELRDDLIPLIYTWKSSRGNAFGFKKTFTLSFLDAAGEDLQDTYAVNRVARYLQHSKGIIFLLDPTQIHIVNDQVRERQGRNDAGGFTEEVAHGNFSEVMDNITALVRTSRGLSQKTYIDIPVAVTFTKIDEVLPIAADAFTIQQPSPHCTQGGFVESDCLSIDAEMRSLLERWGEGATITNISREFKDIAYFGVSALGLSYAPQPDGKVNVPTPHRVEDPLLWLMARSRLIPTIKG